MPKLFGIDIAGIVHGAMSPGLLPATLIVVAPGTRSPSDSTGGTAPTTTNRSCRGVISDYSDFEKGADPSLARRRKILLIAKSIAGGAVPKPNDKITIEGVTYRIVADGVKRDPAAATYECSVER